MRLRHLVTTTATLLLCTLALGLGAANAPATLTGTWQLAVESPMGKRSPSVVLQQEGKALTGTYTGQFGSAPITGTITGSEFTFTFKVSAMMREAVITYVGKLDGNAISGKIQAGGMGEGAFSGVRK